MKRLLLMLLFSLGIGLLLGAVSQSLAHADSLKIGTPFSLEIETDFPLLEVVVPDSLTQFRVLNTHIQQAGQGSKAKLDIVPLRVGALSFPKLKLKARGLFYSGGSTDGFRVFVLSSRAEADTLLRDIKPALRYKGEFPFWLYLFIFLSCLAIATVLIIMVLTRNPPKRPELQPTIIPTEKLIPPYLLALKKLEELERSGLLKSDLLAYHFRLSMILREFLEGTYHFSAREMTIVEIFDALLVSCQEQAESFLQILRYCDMVKFAKLIPSSEQVQFQTQALRKCLVPLAPTRHA